MYLLNAAWGFGSDQIPAPQATLMKMVVEGVMGGTLPWVLIFMGVFIAIVVEILGIPVLAFSIGLYLPIYLSTPIMVGGLIRWFIDNKRKYDSDAARKDGSEPNPHAAFRRYITPPIANAATIAPINSPICCNLGVAPTI